VGGDERGRRFCRRPGGAGKKLRSVLRYELERRKTDDWLADLAEEEADAAHLVQETEPPEDIELMVGAEFYLAAFQELSSDRQIGAMGGCGAIPSAAIGRYADRHRIDDADAFEAFRSAIRAMDAEYLAWQSEKAEAEMNARKNRGRPDKE
jgi:hypothetical protein